MSTKIQLRRGLASVWTSTDPKLAIGEIGYETDTNMFKIGNGADVWHILPYFIDTEGVSDLISGAALGTTDDLSEGITNLYFTNERVATALNSGTHTNITFTYNSGAKTIDVNVPTVQGTQGTQGSAIQGTIGSQGLGGTQGALGTQGTGGYVGADGAQGPQGTQGVQGNTGIQGSFGVQGTQGVQGLVGPLASNNAHASVSSASLSNLTGTYTPGTTGADGGNGVGATITAPSNGRGTVDGVSFTTGNRFLVKNQTDAKQNGIYIITFQGDATHPYILTRASDYDNSSVGEVEYGDYLFVIYGGVNTSTSWIQNSYGSGTDGYIIIGTDNITFAQTSGIGPQGTQGSTGDTGAQGIQGTTGIQGNQGTNGLQGLIGLQGNQGTIGLQGFTGIQGTSGTNGTNGTNGAQGIQGIQGITGLQGTSGTNGSNGAQGVQGIQGLTGSQGTSGTNGVQGNIGSTGIQGTIGVTGSQGTSGTNGSNGAQGTQGTQGIQGLIGTGTQGIQGPSGYTGGTTTVSTNTATTIDTTSLSTFTAVKYIVSIKQGSKVRSSEVIAQTDGTSVDYAEFGVVETGGPINGILVAASVSSTNCVLQVTISDAASTNATVKIQKVLI